MNRRFLILLLLLPCASALAQTPSARPVQWDWFVVSTPDFVGPFRGSEPGFKPPVPQEPLPRTLTTTQKGRVSGTFEVIVTTKGTAELEKVLAVSGPEVRTRAREIFGRWRLEPASLDGKPIRVRLRIVLEGAGTIAQTGAETKDPVTGKWGVDGRTNLDLKFDGKSTVSGTTIWYQRNSYEHRAAIKAGRFDAKTGALKLEGEGKRPDGVVVAYVIEGKIEKDTVTGTFKFGDDGGAFTFKRQ